jgi:hypothetical protein
MKVRRVFYLHHLVASKKVVKMTHDYPAEKSHEECAQDIYERFGKLPDMSMQELLAKGSFENFAEVTHSCISEKEHAHDKIFDAPKHFGTDLLLDPRDYAAAQTAPEKKKKDGKIV